MPRSQRQYGRGIMKGRQVFRKIPKKYTQNTERNRLLRVACRTVVVTLKPCSTNRISAARQKTLWNH
jgi:hypothetical protein